ncbi:hypothetical protein WJX82_005681 [Trebouxia sp. C0006]
MQKDEQGSNTANAQHVVELTVDNELTWTEWFGNQGNDLTEDVVAPQGCYITQDDRWEATAKTEQGQDCQVVGYQMRLDGGCAGARFGFDAAAANRPRTTAATSQEPSQGTVKHTQDDDGLTWTRWFGSQGRKLTEKVSAPQGCYITQWKLGIIRLDACCGLEAFTIPVVVSIQGKYCGNDRDDRWEATAKTDQGEDCRFVAYQMRLDGACAGARFGFGSPGKQD